MEKKKLTLQQSEALIKTLQLRFHNNMHRHPQTSWEEVALRLQSAPGQRLFSLYEMESSGGEPDVVEIGKTSEEIAFFDCSAESPTGRRSVCYDREGLDSRKAHKPENTAVDMATAMGIDLLSEEEYLHLQSLEEFDTKTSSWLKTPPAIRSLGGALFGDRRYDHVFIYHNGAQSYYAARGFRASLKL